MRIVIADDHLLLRQALCRLLAAHADFEVVAEADDGRSAVELAEQLAPDVVLMDIGLPALNGIEATRQIVTLLKNTRVLALSGHTDRRMINEAIKAGASGYLLKDASFEELAEALRQVASRKFYLGPSVARGLVDDFVHNAQLEGDSVFVSLSPREREVLQLIAEGLSTKEVAHTLKVSVKTVETHRRQIMNKLQLFSVAELTRYALREGVVSLDIRSAVAVQ